MNERVVAFWAFARERHAVYLRRAAGAPPPWTSDPVLSVYCFTNVYRALDPTTGAFYAALEGLDAEGVAYASLAFRSATNRRGVLERHGVPQKSTEDALRWLKALKEESDLRGQVAPATHAGRGWRDTERTLVEAAETLLVRPTVEETARGLHRVYGVGPFYVTQVLADLLGSSRSPWPADSYLPPGRGAQACLVYLLDGHMPSPQTQRRVHARALRATYDGLVAKQQAIGGPALTYVDVEHALCEFHKYVSLYHRVGRPNVRRYRWAP